MRALKPPTISPPTPLVKTFERPEKAEAIIKHTSRFSHLKNNNYLFLSISILLNNCLFLSLNIMLKIRNVFPSEKYACFRLLDL